jgi:phage protein D
VELADFARNNSAFYVPVFDVMVGGRSLLRDVEVAVTQAEVDLVLSGPGRFSFTVAGTYNITQKKFLTPRGLPLLDILTFGTPVEVFMGYVGPKGPSKMISGLVTEIATGFSEGGSPELTVSGYDYLYPLTLGANSDAWKDVSDSDVVQKIAALSELKADTDQSAPKHKQIEQNQQSDAEFIKTLAARNNFEFYMSDARVLRFGRPNDRGTGVVALTWGRSLLSFRPEANLAGQIAAVEIRHRDPGTKKEIVGRATAGQASGIDPGRRSAGDILARATGRQVTLRLRQPVFSEAEARKRAEAILTEKSKKFLTGEAETIGIPELRPDKNVRIDGVGEPFSKTYFIEQTTHKVDASGYRTRLKVKEPSQ